MTTILIGMPWAASFCGALCFAKALNLCELTLGAYRTRVRLAALAFLAVALPAVSRAATDLQAATEAGNAIIMYLSGVLAAVGIVAAGVAMMMGRQSIAKWAFAGAMVSGLAFAIVKTMWSNFGLTASDVSSFTP